MMLEGPSATSLRWSSYEFVPELALKLLDVYFCLKDG